MAKKETKKTPKKKVHLIQAQSAEEFDERLLRLLPKHQKPEKEDWAHLEEKMPFLNLLKENGKPQVLYHCTLSRFDSFQPFSFFGTLKAATNVGLETAESLDYITNEERLFDKVKEPKSPFWDWYKIWRVQQVRTIPVCLNLHRPLPVVDLIHHDMGTYKELVLNELEKDTYTEAMKQKYPVLQSFAIAGILMNHKVRRLSPVYNMIFEDPYNMSAENVAKELRLEKLYSVKKPFCGKDKPFKSSEKTFTDLNTVSEKNSVRENDQHNRHCLVMQRMIRFFEGRGYDGLSFYNLPDDKGSITYITFRPEQVIRLDRKLPARIKSLSKERQKRLLALEARALARCTDKWLTYNERLGRMSFQRNILNRVPQEMLKLNESEQKQVEAYRQKTANQKIGQITERYLRYYQWIKQIEAAHGVKHEGR